VELLRLEVVEFRSHEHCELHFGSRANLLIGPNGSGKTGLLEAAYLLATHGSHRLSQTSALLRNQAQFAAIRGLAFMQNRQVLIELELRSAGVARARVNGVAVPRVREALGYFKAVVFAPEDVALVRGEPDQRRRFLDQAATQEQPRFAALRQDYERVVRQRNALLRRAAALRLESPPTLEAWDEQLVRLGASMWAGRLRVLDGVNRHLARVFRMISGGSEEPVIRYVSAVGENAPEQADPEVLAPVLAERLAGLRRQELDRGVSLVGPHRDDLDLRLGGMPARTHASQGEAWLFAAAMKLALREWMAESGELPVLLLDDVFSELDESRRSRLAASLGEQGQTIVTAAVEADIPDLADGRYFDVSRDQVTSRHATGGSDG